MSDRCTYTAKGLRCVRDAHPTDPGAHVRESASFVHDTKDEEA